MKGTSVTTAASQGREARRLSTLLEVSQALSGTLNLKSALHRVLEVLAKHHGAIRSMVTLLREGGELYVEASDGLDRPAQNVQYRMGEGITGRVVETGQADRRAAGQPRADDAQSRGAAVRRRRSGAQLRLRPRRAEPPRRGRARRGSAVQARTRLRQQRQVPRRRRVDDRAGRQDSAADRGGQAAARRRKRASAPGAPGEVRLLEHHRHQRPGAAGVRAGGAGSRDEHDRADPRRVGHRQGADRARDSLQLAARQEAVRQGQLRGAARDA